MKKIKVQNAEEEQATVLKQPKFDKVEKYQASVPQKKHKNGKDGASITPKKYIDTVDKEGKSRKNVVKEANSSPILANNNIYTLNKTYKSQTSKETVDTLKKKKLTHLTQQLNQGLLQEPIYLIKVFTQKNPQI